MKQLFAQRRLWVGALVVLSVSLLFWFVGPLLVVGDAHPLDPTWRRVVLVLFAVLVWVSIELGRLLLNRRRNRQMMNQLTSGGEDQALSQQEAELLQRRFSEALETLKRTKLGGQQGARLLYQLPWYMFIGAPGSGKTTALINSGLRFPLAKPGASASALGGIGGTRNCDWWFTDNAVMIDTAGRYTTHDSNASVDQSAWDTFLGLLKRFRPRQPINGVIVTLSVGDLLSFSAQERIRYGQVVRQRIEELQSRLGVQFPVYVLVTKCDLVAGFTEFFSTFDASQRAQVWGTTFEFDIATRKMLPAKEGFESGFPSLVAKLNEILLARLHEEHDPQRRATMYPFPQQFASLKPLVAEFLETAFSGSKFADQALVRGVYFTSGTQQGASIDRLLGSLSRSLELRAGGAARAPGVLGAAKSFFIGQLITDVIFPEAGLAGHSEQRERRMRGLSWALVCMVLVFGVGFCTLWTVSFLANRDGLERAGLATKASMQSLAAVGAPANGDLPVLVEALGRIRQIPVAVHNPVSDPPLSMGWGLYQGDKVEAQVGERYRNALQQGLMPRIAIQLEAVMNTPQAKPEGVYAALKAYLMMYDVKRLDEGFFVGTVNELWLSSGNERETVQAARAHLVELVRTRNLQVARFHPINTAVVDSARDRVASMSIVARAYSLLSLSANGAAEGVRLSEIVGPAGVGVFERTSGVSLVEPIPYVFTLEGYRSAVKPRIKSVVGQLADEEAWVLGGKSSGVGKGNAREIEAAVLRQFLADYRSTWDGVLQDVKVKRLDSVRAAMNAAQVLAQPDSPLKRLVAAVAEQTRLTASDLKADAIGAAADNAKQKTREAATSATSGIFGNQASQVVGSVIPVGDPLRAQEKMVEEHFSGVRRLAGDGKAGEIDAAIGLINEIFNELVAIQQKLSSGQGLKEIPQAIGRAKAQADRFPMPVSGTIKALVALAEQEASGGVRKEVKAGVGGASALCQRAIPGRYPFDRSAGQDVGAQDFVNVFKIGGDLDTFFGANLAQYVDKSGGVWRLKSSGEGAPPVSEGTLRQFQNADAIRTAFLSGGAAASVTVDVSVVSASADLAIEYDGVAHKLQVGSGTARLAWPARPGAKLSLGGQSVVAVEGAWALFRLIDKGVPDPSSTGDRVRVSYTSSAGQRAVLDIRTGSAAFNPFRLKELAAFACPRE